MRIALAGNPNSGKTTMYNALTGQSEQVGNWAGVTVDKKEHPLRRALYDGAQKVTVVDLPGAYSMSPFTEEENITSAYVKEQLPDVILNIVDATNLSRSLFFTTQLLELGVPVVVALNKSDVNSKKETKINVEKLSELLGCPVVSTISTSGTGARETIQAAMSLVGSVPTPPYRSACSDEADRQAVERDDRRRFAFVASLVREVQRKKERVAGADLTDKIDRVLTNKWLGIPIFALVMYLVFQLSQVWIGAPIADGFSFVLGGKEYGFVGLVPLIERFGELVEVWMEGSSPLLKAVVVDGVVGGVGAVVGFLPLVMVLYFFIALLEDCGYLSRVAVVLDPMFKKVGLSGKSVIPFVISVGCAVPGVMASRTVKDERQRRATALLAPFMPCGAKIPVIALFAGAFFDGAGWVSAFVYLFGIVLIFLVALFIRFITSTKQKSYFIIELPDYKAPSLLGAVRSMLSRGWEYIVKAATIILLCNMAVQLMQSFTFTFAVAEAADESILASVALPVSYLLYPLVGVLSWQLAAAALTGFIAKENVVGTLAVCFVGLHNLIDTEELSLLSGAGSEVAGVMAISKVAALSYLMFNLFSPPCFAAIGAMRSELKSARWLFFGIGLQFTVGYTVSYLVYTLGTLFVAPATLDETGALVGGAVTAALWILLSAGKEGKKA